MSSSKLIVAIAFAGATAAVPFASAADFNVELNVAPPPPRVESMPPAPGEGYVWAPGYWNWSGNQYVWSEGRYVQGRRGEHWVPDRWNEHEGRYRFERGHWDREQAREERQERRRDKDD